MEEQNESKCITISVEEYHRLTKMATMLEVIINGPEYLGTDVYSAVKATVLDMQRKGGSSQ